MSAPRFQLVHGGLLALDGFPDGILVSAELLRLTRSPYIEREGFRGFTIRCVNGAATYRLTHRGPYESFVCSRVRAS